MSATLPFTSARVLDVQALSAYEKQEDEAGEEETFAEHGARYFGGDVDIEHVARDARRHATTRIG